MTASASHHAWECSRAAHEGKIIYILRFFPVLRFFFLFSYFVFFYHVACTTTSWRPPVFRLLTRLLPGLPSPSRNIGNLQWCRFLSKTTATNRRVSYVANLQVFVSLLPLTWATLSSSRRYLFLYRPFLYFHSFRVFFILLHILSLAPTTPHGPSFLHMGLSYELGRARS